MPRLAEIATIVTGVAPEPVRSEAARFIQIKDLGTARRALVAGGVPTVARAVPVRPGDVLVAARGERVVAVAAGEDLVGAYATLDVYLVRPDPRRLDCGYLAAFLGRPTTAARLAARKTGAALPRIPKEALGELEVPLPPIGRQRAIGGLAAAMSDHIDLSTKLLAARARLFEGVLDRAFPSVPHEVR